jgi:predicted  nucleic acid-binding Zn-ribbon protein
MTRGPGFHPHLVKFAVEYGLPVSDNDWENVVGPLYHHFSLKANKWNDIQRYWREKLQHSSDGCQNIQEILLLKKNGLPFTHLNYNDNAATSATAIQGLQETIQGLRETIQDLQQHLAISNGANTNVAMAVPTTDALTNDYEEEESQERELAASIRHSNNHKVNESIITNAAAEMENSNNAPETIFEELPIVAVETEPIVDREEELASLEGGGEAARRVAESAAESEARDAEVATLLSMVEAYREALEASNDNASALREQVIGLEVELADTIARMERASEDRERNGARDGAAYEKRLSAYVDAENALMIELDEKEGIIASLTKERDDGLAQIESLRLELAALKSKADSAMESQLAIIAEKSTVEITYAAPTPADLAKSLIEEECTATFDPVIQLEEVEMKSG